MNIPTIRSRQPPREPWTRERLLHERAIALGAAIADSTFENYSSGLNSYLNFIRLHNLPVEPTPDTLSLFVVYMAHHIKPKSVETYLSGICNQLEPFFPEIRINRKTPIVSKTLAGCKRLRSTPQNRKQPIVREDIDKIAESLGNQPDYNDLLFFTMLLTGFYGLLRLGEMTVPDNPRLRDDRKATKIWSINIYNDRFEFMLPSHKTDPFFEGDKVVIKKVDDHVDPHLTFMAYIEERQKICPLSQYLWVTKDGKRPTRSFFINKLHTFFDNSISGHSLRAGGATYYAEMGVAPYLIQAIGRWTSDAWQRYVRRNPILMHGLMFGRRVNNLSS